MVLEPLKDATNEIIKIFSHPSDQIALVSKSTKKGQLVSVSDGISYEPLSPFQLVEYNYEESKFLCFYYYLNSIYCLYSLYDR
jgi:hypothetical protein